MVCFFACALNLAITLTKRKTNMRLPIRLGLFPVSVFLVLSGCGTYSSMQIGKEVSICCPGNYANYSSFAIENVELPVFLRGYVSEEFDQAFRELGMTRADNSSDLIVNLAYRHVSLDSEQQKIDPLTLEGYSQYVPHAAWTRP
jgi:hypothetical protein